MRSHRNVRIGRIVLVVLILAGTGPAASAAVRRMPEVKGVVNINTATEAQLRQLPGVGAKKAERVIEARTKRPFQSTDQIMRVKGFGRLTYRKLKPYLAVNGATTIARSPAPASGSRARGGASAPSTPEGSP
jgi:competence protein ComEA